VEPKDWIWSMVDDYSTRDGFVLSRKVKEKSSFLGIWNRFPRTCNAVYEASEEAICRDMSYIPPYAVSLYHESSLTTSYRTFAPLGVLSDLFYTKVYGYLKPIGSLVRPTITGQGFFN
jgi:hypothetical protein